MIFSYELNKASPSKMYISKPNRRIIRNLIGVESARLTCHLRDIWEVQFSISKYIIHRTGQKTKNPIYDYLSHSMEINIENIGWFRINSMPIEQYDGEKWYKTFTAYGYETTLQDLDILGLKINCATEDSVEMFEENLDIFEIPKRNIQFYIKTPNDDPESENYWKLGVLNILEHEYLSKKGWSIGDVEIGLASLKGRQFEVDNENVYSFLVHDVAAAFKCIFIFDRINKKINAMKLESLGKNLNIELNLRNVINTITITDQNDDFYTRFRVTGNDSDTPLIEYINYGSDKIVNLDYCINSGMLKDEIVNKYNIYRDFIENNRQAYADYTKSFLELQEKKSILYDQMPIDEVDMLFTNVTDDELSTEFDHFKTILSTLEEIYTDSSGKLNIEGTSDYALYVSVRDVMIPKIQAEIEARKQGKHADPFDYQTKWELYGINELKTKLTAYTRQIEVLTEKGYNVPWSSGSESNETYHNKQYALYQEYTQHVTNIKQRLSKLEQQVKDIDSQLEVITTNQKMLADKSKIEHDDWQFTEEELSDIYMLYRDTDFQDSTIEILDTDDIDDIIQLAWDLYESSNEELEIESHPQMSYEIELDNLFHINKLSQKANSIDIGDFCFMEFDDGYKTKQRIIRMELELVNFNDTDLTIEFSDMVTVCGKSDDYRFLLEGGSSSGKNKISRSTADYISSTANTIATQILSKYLTGGSGGVSVFPNGISQEDIQKLQDALDGLIGGELSLNDLKAKLAQIETLEAGSAFVKYLEAQFLVGNQASFKDLSALVAQIDNLIAGNVSAELEHVINLTAQNVHISDAVIRDLIATRLTVSMLQAGDITLTDEMRILSENGLMTMNGETLQIKGIDSSGNEYVAIQLGYDSKNNPSLIIRDENGAVMLDANGLHDEIVPDEFIKSNMIGKGQVDKDHLSFNIVEADENGNIDSAKVLIDGKGLDAAFTSVKNDVGSLSEKVTGVSSKIDAVEKSITNKVWESDIDNKIDDYDNRTDTKMYDKVSKVEQSVSNIDIGVKSLTSEINNLSSRILDNNIYSVSLRMDDSKLESENVGYIYAILYLNNHEVTDQYEDIRFVWRRNSEFKEVDDEWNSHRYYGKVLIVPREDIEYMVDYQCEVYISEETKIVNTDNTYLVDTNDNYVIGLFL